METNYMKDIPDDSPIPEGGIIVHLGYDRNGVMSFERRYADGSSVVEYDGDYISQTLRNYRS